jgi:hypothetical protein
MEKGSFCSKEAYSSELKKQMYLSKEMVLEMNTSWKSEFKWRNLILIQEAYSAELQKYINLSKDNHLCK